MGIPIAITATETGIEAIKLIKRLGPVKETLVKIIPKYNVLLLGNSGTGKTNLLNSLAEVMPTAIDRLNRSKRSKPYIFKIEGKYFRIIDTPGQEMSISDKEQTIRESLQKVKGIIHVVCYGYHEGSDFGPSAAVVDENHANLQFLEKNRKEEIDDLISFSKFYGPGSKPSWIITVISKADIWWDQLQDVINYYNKSEYGQVLKAKLNNLKRCCVPYCSVIHKYYDILKLSGNFDDKQRIRCKNILISTLLEMAKAKNR